MGTCSAVKAGAARGRLRGEAKVVETPSAHNRLRVKEREKADEDKAGQDDQGGRQHGHLEDLPLTLEVWSRNNWREEGEGKPKDASSNGSDILADADVCAD